jgi:hypothetical protein
MSTTQTTIWVTFQHEGIHCYPAASELEGVEFLQYPHRHVFHFRVEMEVFHDDRDVEFILLKRELSGLYKDDTLMLDYKSCEMIARELLDYVTQSYPDRNVTISVSEDDENGATLVYTNDKE